jgi:hypothetical protein
MVLRLPPRAPELAHVALLHQVPDVPRPDWPPPLPTTRLDLTATDLAADERRLLALGATRPGHALDTDRWIFMADPAGQPFSLTTVY